ncbi:MAG: PhnE/PtxC family ABC transporter permease [Prochlorothrix sp.]
MTSPGSPPGLGPLALLRLPWGFWMVGLGLGLGLGYGFYGRAAGPIVNGGGFANFGAFWAASLHPDLAPDFLARIVRASGITFAYAVCGTVLSVAIGAIGGGLASKIFWLSFCPQGSRGYGWGLAAWGLVRGLLIPPRAIHELIWGLLLLNILGLDPVVAVLAIAIPFGASVAKVFSEILDETPTDPLYALLYAGVSPPKAWLYGFLPLALPNLLSYTFYRFECSLRSAAVLGVIGAGGLGYELLLSLQSLRYDELWTGFYALLVLNGLVDSWSATLRRSLGFTSRLDLNQSPGPAPSSPRGAGGDSNASRRGGSDRSWLIPVSGLLSAIAIPLSFYSLDIGWDRLFSPRSRLLLGEIFAEARPPWPDTATLTQLAQLSLLTLAMSVLAMVLAGLGGILASFPAAHTVLLPGGWLQPLGSRSEARSSPQAHLQTAIAWILFLGTRFLLLLSRAIPAPIWALVWLFILFPGILPGAIALALHNFGILGRLMAEVNENLDDRPLRALHTLGAPPVAALLYSVLPQNLSRFLAYILYRWEVCLRETAIVGLVGAGGLGRLMTEQISSFDYSGLSLTLLCFIVLTLVVDSLSQALRPLLR